MSPYIGVTGFMKKLEVVAALETLDGLPYTSNRKLMVGVLVSSKTLAGRPNKWPNRYPAISDIAKLFPPDRRTVNLIHYATDDRHTLADQLKELISLGGKYLDGFQLNVCWPEPSTIALLPSTMRIVLQLGGGALKEADDDPTTVAKRLDAYQGVITDVLVDASGGRGIPIDVKIAEAYIRTIGNRHPHIGIGVAGGLSSKTCGQLQRLANTFYAISLDAEGRLRTEEDHLNVEEMKDYISIADSLFDH